MTEITQKAMLVRLHIKQWGARKQDKQVTHKIEKAYNATNSGSFNKRLVAEDAIKTVSKTANAARSFHYENTLPWGDDGSRILLSKNYLPYTGEMRRLKASFEEAVAQFIADYKDLVEDARVRLNDMFNRGDYPDGAQIENKYGLEVFIDPLPSAADFRVTLQAEEIDQIRKQIQARNQSAFEEAMRDVWNRLYQSVKHMADKLHQADAVFRNSLVNNLCELCALLPRLNLSDSKELEDMRHQVEDKLCRFEPDELRTNLKKRSQVATDASAILETMKGYIGHG